MKKEFIDFISFIGSWMMSFIISGTIFLILTIPLTSKF